MYIYLRFWICISLKLKYSHFWCLWWHLAINNVPQTSKGLNEVIVTQVLKTFIYPFTIKAINYINWKLIKINWSCLWTTRPSLMVIEKEKCICMHFIPSINSSLSNRIPVLLSWYLHHLAQLTSKLSIRSQH